MTPLDPKIKIPGVTRSGRQAATDTNRLLKYFMDWAEHGAPKDLPEPDEEGMIPWSGGTIPVYPRDIVSLRLRGGFRLTGGDFRAEKEAGFLVEKGNGFLTGTAARFDWEHTGAMDDIIGFMPRPDIVLE